MESTRSRQADTGVDPRELLDAVDSHLVRYGGDFVPNIVKFKGLGSVLRIAPPLTVSADKVDEGVSIIDQALTECAK